MESMVFYKQEKKNRKTIASTSNCQIELLKDDKNIYYNSKFNFQYQRYGQPRNITYTYNMVLNIKTGDIQTLYQLDPNESSNVKIHRPTFKNKKNNFEQILNFTEDGMINGEKRKGFWGVKYDRVIDKIYNLFDDILRTNFKSEFYKNKQYDVKYSQNPIYDLIVDFHLDKKGIKGHDKIYEDIIDDYPKTKWLKKNDYKFLPAVLDSYGIKSKYFISELNNCTDVIYIRSLNYLCKLFGDNYLDYIKKVKWKSHCYTLPYNNRIETLKNDSEKKCMVSLINSWEKNLIRSESVIYSVKRMLTNRKFIESKGIDELKFNCKTYLSYEFLSDSWQGIKNYMNRGYKLKYEMPDDFIKIVETPIVIDNQTFIPKILKTEDEFRVEGFKMKNCMSQQFINGAIYIYLSLQCGRKKINVQYRRGQLSQMYGKANTPVPEMFLKAVDVLSNIFVKHPNIEWKRVKYDIIKK
jgi:hypothetical protein